MQNEEGWENKSGVDLAAGQGWTSFPSSSQGSQVHLDRKGPRIVHQSRPMGLQNAYYCQFQWNSASRTTKSCHIGGITKRYILLPWKFGRFASSGNFGRLLGSPIITQFNVTGVRAVAAVNHSRNQAVSIDLICKKPIIRCKQLLLLHRIGWLFGFLIMTEVEIENSPFPFTFLCSFLSRSRQFLQLLLKWVIF